MNKTKKKKKKENKRYNESMTNIDRTRYFQLLSGMQDARCSTKIKCLVAIIYLVTVKEGKRGKEREREREGNRKEAPCPH